MLKHFFCRFVKLLFCKDFTLMLKWVKNDQIQNLNSPVMNRSVIPPQLYFEFYVWKAFNKSDILLETAGNHPVFGSCFPLQGVSLFKRLHSNLVCTTLLLIDWSYHCGMETCSELSLVNVDRTRGVFFDRWMDFQQTLTFAELQPLSSKLLFQCCNKFLLDLLSLWMKWQPCYFTHNMHIFI